MSVLLDDVRALVVDDNATNRRIYEQMLLNWGMNPTVAVDGFEGLKILDQAQRSAEPYQLVLLDAMMPGLDGFQLAEHLHKLPDIVPPVIIMLSSAGKMADPQSLEELGISTALIKPVKQSELQETIVSVLSANPDATIDLSAEIDARWGDGESSNRLRILLAEDNRVNQRLVVHLLKRFGHAVTVMENGRQAVEAFAASPFDVVLMDVQMPEMDGFEATHAIRELEQILDTRTPIIAMTAHAMQGDRERCLAAGMDAYIAKPFRPDELLEALNTAAGPAQVSFLSRMEAPSAVLDLELLRQNVDGDEEILRAVALSFLEEYPGLISKIQAAIHSQDAAGLHRAAHSLKGAVANFGAEAAYQSLLRLEQLGQSEQIVDAGPILGQLEEALAQVHDALKPLIGDEAA